MQVRAKKMTSPRKPAETPMVPAQPYTFPAPIRGWVLNENLASLSPEGARTLDNWVCTTTGIRVRAGRALYATLGAPVKSLFGYRSGTEMLFAATDGNIFDITTVADPETAPAADVTGLTSGDFSTAQFGTAGGDYLYAVNGADSARLYDGAAWTTVTGVSSPAITGVTTSDLVQVWSHASRLWFVRKNSLEAYYLPVDSIGGAATAFSLAGIFRRGGTLLFGAKWSLNAGDGLDDKCIFVSTEGEVAVYEGTNPSSAATWRLAGRYDMPKPLGRRAYVQAGGDMLIATEAGLIPVSASISTDLGAIETKAVSRPITPYWLQQARARPDGWTMRKLNRLGYMLVASGATCLAVNLITGAWSRFTGWDAGCVEEIEGQGYIGGADGKVYQIETSGSDAGDIYTAIFLGQHSAMGASGAEKTVRQMRPVFRASTPFRAQIVAKIDFDTEASPPPSVETFSGTDGWDVSVWDSSLWDGAASAATDALWTSIGITGTYIAPEVQISLGSAPAPVVELVSIDATYHVGALVA